MLGEEKPDAALRINGLGTQNALSLACKHNLRILAPSTIAAFGPTSPRVNTPDLTIMRPTTMYGVTKVHTELLGEYYALKCGLDFRSLRYPGVLSAETLPGGGTTDYAVDIFYYAARGTPYECYLRHDTPMPMIHIDDLVRGTIEFLCAEPENLQQ